MFHRISTTAALIPIFDKTWPLVTAIVYDRPLFLQNLLENVLDNEISDCNWSPAMVIDQNREIQSNLLEICTKLDKLHLFEIILNAEICNELFVYFDQWIFDSLTSFPPEFFICSLSILSQRKMNELENVFAGDLRAKDIVDLLHQYRLEKYSHSLTYLRFVYVTSQNIAVDKCLAETKFEDSDLLDILERCKIWTKLTNICLPDQQNLQKLIESMLNALSENIFTSSWTILWVAMMADKPEILEMILNNKHYKVNEQIAELLLLQYSKFLIRHNLSSITMQKHLFPYFKIVNAFNFVLRKDDMSLEHFNFFRKQGFELQNEEERTKTLKMIADRGYPKEYSDWVYSIPLKSN